MKSVWFGIVFWSAIAGFLVVCIGHGLADESAELARVKADLAFSQLQLNAQRSAKMESGLVAHRQSLAYTGRDLSHQVIANLVGSADVILEKVTKLRKIGVDHCSALMFPANSVAEMDDQIEQFATEVMAKL